MILAIFLLFVNDLFVFIADGAEAEVWQCPNTSASELIREIWEENRNLSSLFLDLHPDSGNLDTETEGDSGQCVRSNLNIPEVPWQENIQQSMQVIYKLIKSLAWSNVCRLKKMKTVESKNFRAACNRRSTIYNLATKLSLCAGLRNVTKSDLEVFSGNSDLDYMEFLKELIVSIDIWSARSFMCARCRASVQNRQFCAC